MSLPTRLLAFLSALVILSGCATQIQKREALLSASGFRPQPASSSRQAAMLGSLPTDRISPVKHHGHVLFVYPDPAKSLLYVGGPVEYAAYKKARLEQKLAPEEAFDREAAAADLDGWKGLSDGWYNF
jgi:hypothetical protein